MPGWNGEMDEPEVLSILRDLGAGITNSHLVYTSGKHGSAYVNKDAVYPHTQQTSALCRALANKFVGRVADAQIVIGPAVGAVILSQWVAYHLSEHNGYEVLGIYADKAGDDFVIKRGYDKLLPGKRVLIVEDVLTTGGSIKKVVQAVRTAGGFIVGVGALCNRGGVTASQLDVPRLVALTNVQLDAWDEQDCPLCRDGVPINTDVGKGREFLARVKA